MKMKQIVVTALVIAGASLVVEGFNIHDVQYFTGFMYAFVFAPVLWGSAAWVHTQEVKRKTVPV